MQEESLKERFDRAFYGLLEAGNKLNKVAEKVDYAGKLIELNKAKQKQIERLIKTKNPTF